LAHKDKKSVDPLNLSQWDFYILETKVLNNKVKTQKTITLSSLLKLNPTKIKYDNLKQEIERIEKRYISQINGEIFDSTARKL